MGVAWSRFWQLAREGAKHPDLKRPHPEHRGPKSRTADTSKAPQNRRTERFTSTTPRNVGNKSFKGRYKPPRSPYYKGDHAVGRHFPSLQEPLRLTYLPDHHRVTPARNLVQPTKIPSDQVRVADCHRKRVGKVTAPRM